VQNCIKGTKMWGRVRKKAIATPYFNDRVESSYRDLQVKTMPVLSGF